MEWAVCTASSDSEDSVNQELNEEEGEPSNRGQQDSLHEVNIQVGDESLNAIPQPTDLRINEAAPSRNCWDSTQWNMQAASNYSGDSTTQEIGDKEDRLSKRGQHDPFDVGKIKVDEEYPTKYAKRPVASMIDRKATFTRNCWDSMQWTGCAVSYYPVDAAAQEKREGGISNTHHQGSLNKEKTELGEQSTTNDAQRSFEMMIAKEIASNRYFTGSVKAGEGPHKDNRDLIHFGKREEKKLSAPDYMGSTSKINISAEHETFNSELGDLNMGIMCEYEDGKDQVLVTQEDSGESAEELEFTGSTPKFGVREKLNLGRSAVQRKKEKLAANGQGQVSKLVKRSGQLHDNQMHGANTECAESSTDPSYWPENQNAGKSWFESCQTRHLEGIRAVQETLNFTESKETLNHSAKMVAHQEEYATETQTHNVQKAFTCGSCNKMFSNILHLSEHCCVPTEEMVPSECLVCNITFKNALCLIKHQTNFHKKKLHKCTICSARYSSVSKVRKHQWKMHQIEKQYNCLYCPETFTGHLEFNSHLRSHIVKVRYKCTECNRVYRNENKLSKHQCTPSEEKLFKCTRCPEQFTGKKTLQRHRKSHQTKGESREGGYSSGIKQ